MASNNLEDSVCILYEKIEPRPEIEIVEEINISNSEEITPPAPQAFVDICDDSSENLVQVISSEDNSISILQDNNRIQPEILCVDRVPSKNRTSPRNRNSKSQVASRSAGQDASQRENLVSDNVLENSSKNNKIRCGICFEGPEEMSNSRRTLGSTFCGHLFCSSCMEESRKNSSQCPTCRKKLTKNQFHPIYF